MQLALAQGAVVSAAYINGVKNIYPCVPVAWQNWIGNKILTKEQLETVEHIKKSGIDITKNWFIFDTQSDEFAESEDFKFWVTIQLEEGDDQDPMCEDFLPDNIKNNLHNYAEVVFGYDGDLSEEEFIKELDKSNFFTYKK
jgi:hypothetical protein